MPLLSDCDTVAPGLGQGEGPELTLFAGRSAAMWRARLACVSARGVAKACQGVRFHNQVWSRALVSNEHPWHRLANAFSVWRCFGAALAACALGAAGSRDAAQGLASSESALGFTSGWAR